MARFKKGSAAAKAWGAKMRRLRGHHSKSKHSLKSYVKTAKTKSRSYKMAKTKKKHHRVSGGSLLGLAEKISKIAVVAAPAASAMTQPSDKIGWLVSNYTGVNIHTRKWNWDAVVESYTPIAVAFIGWKVFHKVNGLLRKV